LRFALEASQGLGIFGDFIRQEFESNEAVQAGVLGFVDYTHTSTTELFQNTVVREGLTEERPEVWHLVHILGCCPA
jgi:hypothetical protein